MSLELPLLQVLSPLPKSWEDEAYPLTSKLTDTEAEPETLSLTVGLELPIPTLPLEARVIRRVLAPFKNWRDSEATPD